MSIVLNNTLYTRYQKVINLSVASCLILFFLDRVARALKSNYTRWYSLAPGGVPHNLLGWIVNWLLWPLGDSDMTSIRPYLYPAQTKQYGKAATQKNLREPLPWREPYAARPFVEPDFSVPQRQESQPVPGHLKEVSMFIHRLPPSTHDPWYDIGSVSHIRDVSCRTAQQSPHSYFWSRKAWPGVVSRRESTSALLGAKHQGRDCTHTYRC